MADKKVYAWVCQDEEYSSCFEILIDEVIAMQYAITEPLYSIEEVQHVIENNKLPKQPVAWVCWDNHYESKIAYQKKPTISFNNMIPVYSADELLAELQKEI